MQAPGGCPWTHLPPTVGPVLTSVAGPGATGLESAACCSSATYWLYEEVQNAMLGSAWLKTSFRKQTQHAHTRTHTHLHTGTPQPAPLQPPVALSNSCWFTCCHEYRCVQFLCSGRGRREKKERKCMMVTRGSEKTSSSSFFPVFQNTESKNVSESCGHEVCWGEEGRGSQEGQDKAEREGVSPEVVSTDQPCLRRAPLGSRASEQRLTTHPPPRLWLLASIKVFSASVSSFVA